MNGIFKKESADGVIDRINKLTSSSPAKWGKMNVSQMLGHCNVAFDMTFDVNLPKPKGLKKFFLKFLIKPIVVGAKPYKKNGRTAPAFLIVDERDFQKEKSLLIAYIEKVQDLGASHFHNKDSHSFGVLTSKEWDNMFYKHLDHHLQQFGV